MQITRVRGFSDILPGDAQTWRFVEEAARRVFARYNFSEIRIPILEKTDLFSRSLGETTDIVEKEMYTFADRDGSHVTLRPEGTAGVVRAYLEAGMHQADPVQKLFYMGPMFRRERPQKGRLRQFHQIGAEILGRGDPLADAEILILLSDLFQAVKLDGLELELNSLGCPACRPGYRAALLEFLRKREEKLCDNCRRRMERNPLRVLDCKEETCRRVTGKAPSMPDFLCEACQAHFATVKSLLQKVSLGFRLNPRMVRGLDYYCRTAFEWTSQRLGSQNAVAAGGRYDGLVKELGGPSTPGIGFALGMERLVSLLGSQENRTISGPELYIAWVGMTSRTWVFPLAHRLRQKGLRLELEGEERSLKSQMRRADRMGARNVLIVGENELKNGKAILRSMERKEQSEVGLDDIESELSTYIR